MKRPQHIAIVGAGLVGCMLATLLARRGHMVSVFEKREESATLTNSTGRSTHLAISARGWRAIEAIDAGPEVLRSALPLKGRRIHSANGMEQIFQPYGDDEQAIFAIHRNVLNRILARICASTAGVTMHFSHQCMHVDASGGVLELTNSLTGEGLTVQADYIFAADGAFSKVRERATGSTRIRSAVQFESFGYKEVTIPVATAASLEPDAMHAWPRGEVSLFAFPNPDRTFTATLLAPFKGPNGFTNICTAEDVERVFAQRFPDVAAGQLCAELLANPVNSLVTVRCTPWTIDGRLALLGDAAHAMVPFLGQGMNAGFEDCMAITEMLDQHDEDFRAVLSRYEQLRKPHCDAVTTMSANTFDELTKQVASAHFHLKKQLERTIHRLYPERFVPPYELIAFTHVPYAEVQRRIEQLDNIAEELVRRIGPQGMQDENTVEHHIQTYITELTGDACEA
ncbi:FAD-dependent oxidoreductase [Duganella sp. FT80W]|uniref:FAD-dependent oxidoreductase n=1 Tax=Duganella guangzhouensis TaxID=2666084 RepID=A0A6I2KWE0_9BURK|nr:NAD(P)/FAD-dependent oxidoreductase [Duganella guangzhouensis]MRW90063.1 FAD-dependent oxidoreductase [Duganella guangzhouensis]